MKKLLLKRKSGGYTIIETMIAISLFIIIVMAGMGAVFNANLLHQKSKDMRSIIDNLSFIMEDMSRNLRTGYEYKCFTSTLPSPLIITTMAPQNCAGGGWAIAFKPQGYDSLINNNQWVYKIESQDGGITFNISKSTDNGVSWVQMTPSEIHIDPNPKSIFIVSGALPVPRPPLLGDTEQPFVTIKLSGNIEYKDIKSPFSLQTSVSQRKIDI